MSKVVKEDGGYTYIETSPGKDVLLLLHGLFGSLSNFDGIVDHFQDKYNVILPMLPIFDLPLKEVSVRSYAKFVQEFVAYKSLDSFHLLGNSLGGHIAQIVTLELESKIKSLILTGSSGLYEKAFGNGFVKRGDYDYIKTKAGETFYDSSLANKEMVDEIYAAVNDRKKAMALLYTAKSAIRENLEKELKTIKTPTLLIWGKQDTITPPFVAEKFNELLENSELHWIDKCCHAPMMEQSDEFNEILGNFLNKF